MDDIPDAPPPAQLQARGVYANQANGHSSWVKRRSENIATTSASLLPPNAPSRHGLEGLKQEATKLRHAFEQCVHRFESLLVEEADDDRRRQYQAAAETATTRYRQAWALFTTTVGRVEALLAPPPPPAPPAAGAAAAAGALNPRAVEKPEQLTPAFSPIQYRRWKHSLRLFFTVNGISVINPTEQLAVLLQFLNKEMISKLEGHPHFHQAGRRVLRSDPPVDDSFEETLDSLWAQLHPISCRRVDFFDYRMKKGDDLEECSSHLRALAVEADVASMGPNEILKYRYWTCLGAAEPTLAEEWGRLREPYTLEDMEETLRKYTLSKKYRNAVMQPGKASLGSTSHPAAATAAAAPSQGSGQKGSKKKKATRKGKLYFTPPKEWAGLCLSCGEKGHDRDSCKADVTCSACKTRGHVSKVCYKSWKTEHEGQAHTTTSATPPSPPASPPPTYTTASRTNVVSIRSAASAQEIKEDSGSNLPTPQVPLTIFCRYGSDRSGPTTPSTIRAMPDTGATRSIISARVARRLGLYLWKSSALINTASGQPMHCNSKVLLQASVGDHEPVSIKALVSRDLTEEMLISWHDLVTLGILPANFPEVGASIRAVSSPAGVSELIRDFPDVLSDELTAGKVVKGRPMHIHFKEGVEVKPVKHLTPSTIPLHLQAPANELVAELLSKGFIRRLSEQEPTPWLSRGHFLLKPDGKRLRLVTDYVDLNNYIERPVHPFPQASTIVRSIRPDSKWFAKLDAVNGYFQIPLDKPSQLLTAFLLPQGRFVYQVAPMGLNPSGDWFCQKSDEALVDLPGVTKLVDDILVQGATREELISRVRAVLRRCREHGFILSRRKIEIGQEVSFAGHLVGDKGVKPDPSRLSAIRDFPSPKDLTSLKSFLGMANQVGPFIPDLAHVTAPLRGLLKKGAAWIWLSEHEAAFRKSKEIITSAELVRHFDTDLRSIIYTDASKEGLGYLLVQEQKDGGEAIVACGSRATNAAESRYAPVELECLAAQYAVEQLEFFLKGSPKPFLLITDHRPLEGIFRRPIGEIPNPRLQRIRLRMAWAHINVQWRAGKFNKIADALSRSPVFPAQPLTEEEEREEAAMLHQLSAYCRRITAVDAVSMEEIAEAVAADTDYNRLVSAVSSGCSPQKLSVSHPARAFQNAWGRIGLHNANGTQLVVVDGTRLVPPTPLRRRLVDLLHVSHPGMVKMRQLAKSLYYWPGMNAAVIDRVTNCSLCREALPSKPAAPLHRPDKETVYPMQAVAVDLAHLSGQTWLIMVDRFSGRTFSAKLHRLDTETIVSHMQRWFYDFGFPERVRSDGGPQFRGPFSSFCRDNGICHELSSAYNPQSNGLAESAVKNVKAIIGKCQQESRCHLQALHEFHDCPRADGFSPNQLFFGRRSRGILPALPCHYHLSEQVRGEGRTARQEVMDSALQKTSSRPPPAEFAPGDIVLVQHPASKKWDRLATVLSKRGESYSIIFESGGRVQQRNQIHLRLASEGEKTELADEADSLGADQFASTLLSDNTVRAPDPVPVPLRRSERIAGRGCASE